jgi:hypothetical protein
MRQNVQAYLDVPYEEKNEAKSLGAWWDPQEKKWFVPKGKSLEDFSKWLCQDDENES